MVLLNPKKHSRHYGDEASRQIMLRTIEFFERKGRRRVMEDDHACVWYADFLEFVKGEQIFARVLTPPQHAGGDPDSRWDTWRNCELNEILGFYGLAYWYTWQVSMLGLGPIWISDNQTIKERAGELLREGAIFAFGLSEKEHGADIYSSDMHLIPQLNEHPIICKFNLGWASIGICTHAFYEAIDHASKRRLFDHRVRGALPNDGNHVTADGVGCVMTT